MGLFEEQRIVRGEQHELPPYIRHVVGKPEGHLGPAPPQAGHCGGHQARVDIDDHLAGGTVRGPHDPSLRPLVEPRQSLPRKRPDAAIHPVPWEGTRRAQPGDAVPAPFQCVRYVLSETIRGDWAYDSNAQC
jgi:hypothetical protein